MSSEFFIRCLFAGSLSIVIYYVVFNRFDTETGSELSNYGRQKYLPYINPTLLPVFIVTLLSVGTYVMGFVKTLEFIFPSIAGVFIHISVYYLVLMLLIPYFRKRISSRACALLWLLPNFLYVTIQTSFELVKPAIILHLSQTAVLVILILWSLGFLFILARAIVQHFSYRRSILKNAVPVEDPEVLKIWQQELVNARIKKPKYKLVISAAVTSPLSIGFFQRSIRVVLPDRYYTQDELTMILRHEIIHICRADSENKFFMVFCCAMCWFNPLMWKAMHKSAEDLELSCDETVLLKADDKTRQQYADLILRTKGDNRGFTTCLSASPSTLRYRLRYIVRPVSQSSGALTVAVVFFILLMTSGYLTISYGDFTGNAVFYEQVAEIAEIDVLNLSTVDRNHFSVCKDEDALNTYLSNLHLQKISSNYSFSKYDNHLLIFYNTDSGQHAFELYDQFLKIQIMGRASRPDMYFVKSEVDWDYLLSLFK